MEKGYKRGKHLTDTHGILEEKRKHGNLNLDSTIKTPISLKVSWRVYYDIAEKIKGTQDTYTSYIRRCIMNDLYGRTRGSDAWYKQLLSWIRKIKSKLRAK
jgi:hypothetical protein